MTPDEAAALLTVGFTGGSCYGGPSCTSKAFLVGGTLTGDET